MKPLVLVVENDAGTRKLLEALLTRTEIESDLVSGGREAILLLEHVDYAAVVLDLILDTVTGVDVLTFIAENKPGLLAHTIVLSSTNERQLTQVRETFGGVHVIRKPFDIGELLTGVSTRTEGTTRVADVEQNFCRRSIAAGAFAGLIVSLDSDGIASAVMQFGYPPGLVESYWPLSIETQYPICAAMRNAKPVWIASINSATAEYPLLAAVGPRAISKALAAIPLLRNDVVIGAAGWSFRQPRLFADAERETFKSIATLATSLLENPSESAKSARA